MSSTIFQSNCCPSVSNDTSDEQCCNGLGVWYLLVLSHSFKGLMTHLIAFSTMVVGTGILAKIFPKVMVWVFERFPQHFKPQDLPSTDFMRRPAQAGEDSR